jgi:hypothetical protein
MQYEQVYHIVDEIFARYNGKGCEECMRRSQLFTQIMTCARRAEEEGYDDETVLAAFLPDIEYFVREQKKEVLNAGIFHKCHLVQRNEQLLLWNGTELPKQAGVVAKEDIWRMKEKITRYLISLVDGPAKAYV